MEATLGEIQKKAGVIGSFVIGENSRKIASSSVDPDRLGAELLQKLEKLLKLTHNNSPFDYILFESENGKILVYNLSEKLLVILTSPTANPLVIHSIVKKNLEKLASKPTENKAIPSPKQAQAEGQKTTREITAEEYEKLTPKPPETEKIAITPEDLNKLTKQPQTKKTTREKETEKIAITPEDLTKLTKQPQTKKTPEIIAEELNKFKIKPSETKTTLKPEDSIKTITKLPEIEKVRAPAEKKGAKPGLEELGRAMLIVDTSAFQSPLDLIVHFRTVYGADRFLATRFLEFGGKELRVISREIKMSIEAIVDLIEKDPTVFSIKLTR